ncbi:hypothetical protein AB0H18_10645 [Streptomyces sp. NPDC020766]|uniref:hypothetical protein n=1 Tax=Streptomyces sp. NPDC020766 TaxID=3155011 RepID=UPI0033F64C08
MSTPAVTDLETRVLNYIRNHRKEDGGIYLTRVIGGFNDVETADVEAVVTRLRTQGRVFTHGREKTAQRVFLSL